MIRDTWYTLIVSSFVHHVRHLYFHVPRTIVTKVITTATTTKMKKKKIHMTPSAVLGDFVEKSMAEEKFQRKYVPIILIFVRWTSKRSSSLFQFIAQWVCVCLRTRFWYNQKITYVFTSNGIAMEPELMKQYLWMRIQQMPSCAPSVGVAAVFCFFFLFLQIITYFYYYCPIILFYLLKICRI